MTPGSKIDRLAVPAMAAILAGSYAWAIAVAAGVLEGIGPAFVVVTTLGLPLVPPLARLLGFAPHGSGR